jgi:hypothetical protein
LQRLLDTYNQGASWMAVTSCHYSLLPSSTSHSRCRLSI